MPLVQGSTLPLGQCPGRVSAREPAEGLWAECTGAGSTGWSCVRSPGAVMTKSRGSHDFDSGNSFPCCSEGWRW